MNPEIENGSKIKKQIGVFLVIATALTTALYIWMFATGSGTSPVAGLAMMWIPAIAAIITSLVMKDPIGAYGWKPGKVKILGAAYLLPLLVAVIAYGIAWLSPLVEFSSQEPTTYKWAAMLGFTLPVHFMIGVLAKMTLGTLLTLIFTVGEEIGWSGFLTRKMLKVTSTGKAGLYIGLIWAVWHFPAIIGGIYVHGQETPLWVSLTGFTLFAIAFSLIRALLMSRCQSVWVGGLLHASSNIIYMGLFWEMTVRKGYAAYLLSETGIFAALVYLVVAVFFWRIRKRK